MAQYGSGSTYSKLVSGFSAYKMPNINAEEFVSRAILHVVSLTDPDFQTGLVNMNCSTASLQ